MQLWQVLALAVLEGLTEFVPVSSTGHLILASRVLGLSGPAVNAFNVAVQLGALLAAVVYYRETLWTTAAGALQRQPAALRLVRNLLLGALPVLALGYLLRRVIKQHLFGPRPVVAALFVGGVVMLALDLWRRRRPGPLGSAAELSGPRALAVGLVQALALWPGTSRSMASIAGGQLVGLRNAPAADFAFLLAIPTLGAATLYELIKERAVLVEAVGTGPLLLGLAVSFAVGLVVIAGFLRYLRRFGLWAFGLYRIGLAALLLLL